jgi:FKBP-type peptidyl-prolyl cis-trans isomerase SlpA
MRMSQIGDRIQAHYTKRFTDGSSRSSRRRGEEPLELVIGNTHPSLPAVTSRLVGLGVGQKVTIQVSASEAYGMPDPTRIFRVDRARFRADEKLKIGDFALMQVRDGRARRVRVLEIHERIVVIDANHPRCGQSLELEMELVAFMTPVLESNKSGHDSRRAAE